MLVPDFLEVLGKPGCNIKGSLKDRAEQGAPHVHICCSVIPPLGLLHGNLVSLGGGMRLLSSAVNMLLTQYAACCCGVWSEYWVFA